MIDTKSKIFMIVLFVIIITSLVISYERYIIREDFFVFTDEETIPSITVWDANEVLNIKLSENIILWKN